MQRKMNKNRISFKFLFLSLIFFTINYPTNSEIIKLSGCTNNKDGFIKNEYILDLEKSLMTRSYIYNNKTFKKYRMTDISIKKENFIERFIYEDKNFLLTDKVGYPQFYTQLVFEKNNPNVNIKTVINGEEALSKITTCKKIDIFDKES
jgi:hypothetical protein